MRTNRRFSNRIFTRVRLLFGPQKPDADGYALNVSAEGLFISATRLHQPGTRLLVRLLPLGIDPIDLVGTVRWGLRVPPQLVSVVKPGMGLLLATPPRAFLDFLSALAASKAQRAHPRIEARFEVRYYHRKEFLKDYTENISQGGLFIATDEALEPGTQVAVELVIPDLATVLALTGRIVYRLDEAQATALGTATGVGVQIAEIDPRTEETLRTYVQRLMRLYE